MPYPPSPPAQPGLSENGPQAFVPPAFWGKYPSLGAPQTSHINTRNPPPPMETGPGYGNQFGYAPPIGSSLAGIQQQKTIYPGPAQAQASGSRANLVFRVDQNGNLSAYDAVSNLTFQIP